MAQEITFHIENLFFDRTAVRVNEVQLCLIFGRRFATKCFLLDTSWKAALTDHRGVNESLLKLEDRELARVSSSDSRKAFPRIVEGLNTMKGKRRGEKKRTWMKEAIFMRERENETGSLGILTIDSFPEEQSSMREFAVFLNASDYFHQLLQLRFLAGIFRSTEENVLAENSRSISLHLL